MQVDTLAIVVFELFQITVLNLECVHDTLASIRSAWLEARNWEMTPACFLLRAGPSIFLLGAVGCSHYAHPDICQGVFAVFVKDFATWISQTIVGQGMGILSIWILRFPTTSLVTELVLSSCWFNSTLPTTSTAVSIIISTFITELYYENEHQL